MAPFPSHILHILILQIFIIPNLPQIVSFSDENEVDWLLFHGDYSPPSPPPPSPPPHPPSASCEDDLKGVGSLNSRCDLSDSLNFTNDVYIAGKGSLFIYPGVVLSCPIEGCSILFNLSGELSLGSNAEIVAGTVAVKAFNVTFASGSLLNATALAGPPPEQTSGIPSGLQGAGGGHGGRGASCVVDNKKLPEDVWGGDTYAWSTLTEPWSYGSKGGTTNREEEYGGRGGGRVGLDISNAFEAHGSILADGGDGGTKGGGGSGGSIFIKAQNMKGSGKASASGGSGFAGGGGGRVSANVFSMHDEFQFLVHGGGSYGCPKNSGAAGTFYDVISRKLVVSNHNKSTDTDTLLLEFPNQPLWTNIFIRNRAKAAVPLLWSRVQVQGQLSLSCGATLSFGLAHYGFSEFELIAEELLMSDSLVKVYGALRMTVKVHLMWNSTMLIDGDGDSMVSTSLLEASNLVVLRESSMIHSNANLGVHGQGFLNLSGPGDLIEAQRLVLSLFYSITLGAGSILRGPIENASNHSMTPKLYCGRRDCPDELLHPPEDCSVNSTLAFTLQICRVEDINLEGSIEGSVIHFHWVRSVAVKSSGVISASGLGCTGGVGRGMFLTNGLGGGGGHGGKGGSGYYNGSIIKGGVSYGNADLPCELGSGSGNYSLAGVTSGAGIIVMGSLEHSLESLSIDGSLRADGQSFGESIRKQGDMVLTDFGPGGGSGGTVLLFLQSLSLRESSAISTAGGHGGPNGGGGGGGRVHFHWSNIPIGDEYFSLATVNGSIHVGGGQGGGLGYAGENGTVTGKTCPKGLYGIFCQECPVGTYKNVSGSNRALCRDCPSHELPIRAIYTPVRGGVGDTPCPYKCLSERYQMPHCHTALEELVYTFGGPWLFGLILLVILVLLALVLSVARMKFVSVDELPGLMPTRRGLQIDRSLPFLESLNEVLETSRIEESKTHVHRLYFMGPNTFSEPWHLPYSPPEQVLEIVYEDAFNTFVDEINALAAYHWWEGSMYMIMSLLAYPLAWSWLQWRQKIKIQRLREFVRSEYDHACLRSCRSRALYEGLKVAATSDLMLGYVDFFLGGDEKRADLPPQLRQRLPMSVLFGGDGSYMAPFSLQSDNILTSLMSQSVPPTIWYRLVAGLNAQLRLVRCGRLRKSICPILSWLDTFANPTLKEYGIRVDLACFQPTGSGYPQFGLSVLALEGERVQQSFERPNISLLADQHSRLLGSRWRKAVDLITHKRIVGGILHPKSLQTLGEKKNLISYPLSFVLHNVKPVGHQDLVGLVISILLLGDFSLVLLTLLQLYSFSLLDLLLFLFILPLGILCPFPAGINALFSHGPRRSAGLARLYALWNILSLINVVVAFICGFIHYKTQSSASKKHQGFQSWNFNMDDGGWWMLSFGLVLCKVVQARLINYHVANLEIQDKTLYSNDADVFWQS